ncbi:CDP-diacylglycerol--serine O-phosphatidyltransferase [Aliidongia dinghuensis]|uniref:CDP-diacylglycerol--serine O-phosphatidyltransferase n=1 Tax=Aliidongia dinghuensis TaxID=1867774 RepID=A0A8J2YUI9_9PROT|nr:CDP-diacylglycerol--serine O-phosphatidyltransferase [Aliidongia dinghuensis]GGF21605.1 CDP-diacylglycerol--serine O-phosphatidyltransferase [Aliidongia dinghuensis]
MRPIGGLSINRMIPNMLTLLALCAGMTAIRFAVAGKFEQGVSAILIAGVLDGLDGRIARLLKSTSSFGAQLDSLSDFISFGVAPAVLLYVWTMQSIGSPGWAVACLFAVCMSLRLARFNTQLGLPDPPPYAYNFFTGVPAPAAAGLSLMPVVANFEFGADFLRSPYLIAATTAIISGLMVSRVPTFSFKRFRIPHDYVVPVMLGIGAFAAFLAAEPWETLLVLGLIYLGLIPLSVRSYRRLKRAAEEIRAGRGDGGAVLRAVDGGAQQG